MTFTFEPRKRTPTTAKPANSANPDQITERISNFSDISNGHPQFSEDPNDFGYTLADLAEMDRLLRQLAELEDWKAVELDDLLDQRRRMAPANVPAGLKQIKIAVKAAIAQWPSKPAERSRISLCQSMARNDDSRASRSSKTPALELGAV